MFCFCLLSLLLREAITHAMKYTDVWQDINWGWTQIVYVYVWILSKNQYLYCVNPKELWWIEWSYRAPETVKGHLYLLVCCLSHTFVSTSFTVRHFFLNSLKCHIVVWLQQYNNLSIWYLWNYSFSLKPGNDGQTRLISI